MFSYPPCSLCLFYVSIEEHGNNYDDDDDDNNVYDDADEYVDYVDDDKDVLVQEQCWQKICI